MKNGKGGTRIGIAVCIIVMLGVFSSTALAVQYTVSGTVMDSDGLTVQSVALTFLDPATGTSGAAVLSAIDGSYIINVEHGTYNMIIAPPAESIYQTTVLEGITISADTVHNIVLITKDPTISGRVLNDRGETVPGVRVILVDPEQSIHTNWNEARGWSYADENGEYSITVPSGTYDIVCRKKYFASQPDNSPPHFRSRVERMVEIMENTTHDIQLPLRRITGTVTDGNPVAGVKIGNELANLRVYREETGNKVLDTYLKEGYTSSDETGRFDYPLIAGTYNIAATPSADSGFAKVFMEKSISAGTSSGTSSWRVRPSCPEGFSTGAPGSCYSGKGYKHV